jgi:NAD(P)-dependent dehydrogenase (short-subunit alcohol dehydrogenase family)
MKGKVVLVTGATGALGSLVTEVFLEEGATVIGTSPKSAASVFPQKEFIAIPGEITTLQSAKDLTQQIVSRFDRLDVLAHTVGGFAGGQSVVDTDDATLHSMMNINFNVTFHMLRAVIPLLRESGNGRVIAIGSRAAVDPGVKVGAYSASKAAMVSLIRTVAEENKDAGITANVILPGTMDTPSNRKAMPHADFSKWVQPGRVAALVAFLASDAAKDINGAVIPMYGDA